MIRWPFRYKGKVPDPVGKERAKAELQSQVADALLESSIESAHEHRFLLYTNHMGPNARIALREPRRP